MWFSWVKVCLNFLQWFCLEHQPPAWDTKAYPEVKQLQMKADALWIPDLEMFNALNFGPGSLSDTLRHPKHNAVVFPSGDVIYIPPVNGNVPCNQQECYDGSKCLWEEYDCKIA